MGFYCEFDKISKLEKGICMGFYCEFDKISKL